MDLLSSLKEVQHFFFFFFTVGHEKEVMHGGEDGSERVLLAIWHIVGLLRSETGGPSPPPVPKSPRPSPTRL